MATPNKASDRCLERDQSATLEAGQVSWCTLCGGEMELCREGRLNEKPEGGAAGNLYKEQPGRALEFERCSNAGIEADTLAGSGSFARGRREVECCRQTLSLGRCFLVESQFFRGLVPPGAVRPLGADESGWARVALASGPNVLPPGARLVFVRGRMRFCRTRWELMSRSRWTDEVAERR